MTEKYTVGIDVGGSATKSAIYDLRGKVVGEGKGSYHPHEPLPGVAEYDAFEILRAVDYSLKTALTQAGVSPKNIVSITVDAMISGTVGINSEGVPTTPYTTTLDTRFSKQMDHMIQSFESRIRELVGSGAPVIAAKIKWHLEHDSKLASNTSKFVTAGGLVGAHLAGLKADDSFVDPTVLWAFGLSDTKKSEWSPELIEKLEVPKEYLPTIVPCSKIVGGLSQKVAQETGLLSGTPIVAGMGDQAAGFLGAGLSTSGDFGESAGTYLVLSHHTDKFEPDPGGRFDVVPSVFGQNWQQQSVIIGGGHTRNWAENLLVFNTDSLKKDFDTLVDTIAPGSDGLFFVPHLGGQNGPIRTSMRGSWLGLEWSHGRGNLARAVLEALAFESAIAIDSMSLPDEENSPVIVFGGGTGSNTALQIKADVTGRTYANLGDIAPANLATAFLGAFAVGEVDDIQKIIRDQLKPAKLYTPEAKNHLQYQSFLKTYKEAVNLIAEFRKS
jgi:xylulokinase